MAPGDVAKAHNVADVDVTVAWVPGAFELPLVAKHLAELGMVRQRGVPRRGHPGRHPHFDLRRG